MPITNISFENEKFRQNIQLNYNMQTTRQNKHFLPILAQIHKTEAVL